MPEPRAYPIHPELPHLRPLSYFLIAGAQPMGRTEILRPTPGRGHVESALQVIKAVMKAHADKVAPANA